MRNFIAIAFASLSLSASAVEAAPNFYQVGQRFGNSICSTYNKNAPQSTRYAAIQTAMISAFFSDEQVTYMMMNDIDLNKYQEEQHGLGMLQTIYSMCPQQMMSAMEDAEYAFWVPWTSMGLDALMKMLYNNVVLRFS